MVKMHASNDSKEKYICDDRDVMENLQKIRSMTDEEFEAYAEEQKKKINKIASVQDRSETL